MSTLDPNLSYTFIAFLKILNPINKILGILLHPIQTYLATQKP